MTNKQFRKRNAMCERPPFNIDVAKVGPFIRGYILVMLELCYADTITGRKPLCWHDPEDLTQATLAQVMRDCLYFFAWHKNFILDKDKNESQLIAGKRFFLARIGCPTSKGWERRVRTRLMGHYAPRFRFTNDDKIMMIYAVDGASIMRQVWDAEN